MNVEKWFTMRHGRWYLGDLEGLGVRVDLAEDGWGRWVVYHVSEAGNRASGMAASVAAAKREGAQCLAWVRQRCAGARGGLQMTHVWAEGSNYRWCVMTCDFPGCHATAEGDHVDLVRIAGWVVFGHEGMKRLSHHCPRHAAEPYCAGDDTLFGVGVSNG